MNDEYWLVADYFDKFRCKCGECRHTCCGGWRIAVGEQEYYRIIGMECSDKLHEKIEGAFVRPDFPTPERYMLMEADWTGRCRMLDEDGMCMLQKECGEETLTEVCRVYPRSYKSENGLKNACCSGSCERVAELLMRRAPLIFRPESGSRLAGGRQISPKICDVEEYDAISLFDEVVTALQDRSIPLTERIERIFGRSGVSPYEHGMRKKIAESGVYAALLPILREFCDEAPSFSDYVTEVENRYFSVTFDEQFDHDRTTFEEHFPDWSCYFENMICNNMLYSSFPAVDPRVDPHMAVLGISLQYTLLRIICICHTAVVGYTQEALADAIAEVYHVVEHTAFYYNAVVLLR